MDNVDLYHFYKYFNMDKLDSLLTSINITISRIRDFNFMAFSKGFTPEEVTDTIHDFEMYNIAALIDNRQRWKDFRLQPTLSDSMTYNKRRRYFQYNKDGEEIGVKWKNIHGRHRKTAKFWCKKSEHQIVDTMNTFNKYVGKNDVLRINARLGGINWRCFGGIDIEKHPAFIEKVDSCYEETYCDIYIKIDPQLVKDYVKRMEEE